MALLIHYNLINDYLTWFNLINSQIIKWNEIIWHTGLDVGFWGSCHRVVSK